MILKYGNYTFVLSPEIKKSSSPVGAGLARQAARITWQLSGTLTFKSGGDVVAQVAALEAAFAANAKDLILYANNGTTVVDQLATATALGGVRVTKGPEYPTGKGAELVTVRHYEITAEGVYRLSDALFGHGHGKLAKRTRLQPDGRYIVTVSGDCTADTLANAYVDAAAAKLPGLTVISEDQVEDADRRNVTFAYEYEDPDQGREITAWTEDVEYQAPALRVVAREVFGAAPVLQTTTIMAGAATQSGQAEGKTAYPSAPNYVYDVASLNGAPKFRKSYVGGAQPRHVIVWTYSYIFATTPGVAIPNPNEGST
jgi:hypothetical protein